MDNRGAMQVIIDGHNLIPKIPGMSLQNLDDETGLIPLLQKYSRIKRHSVEVYFDGALPGHSGFRKYGLVRAYFIRKGSTADEAIIARVQKAGKQAAAWLVVSSDRHIQQQVRPLGCKVVTAESFAAELMQLSEISTRVEDASPDHISKSELEEFLRMFGGDEESS